MTKNTINEATTYTATDKAGRVWGEGPTKQAAREAARDQMRLEGAGGSMQALALKVEEGIKACCPKCGRSDGMTQDAVRGMICTWIHQG